MNPGALDNEAFTVEFNAVIKRRGLSTERVARHLSVSEDMIERWRTGVSSPLPSIREMVLHDLENSDIP